MAETNDDGLTFEEQQARTKARRAQLEAPLAGLAVRGKEVYRRLRPLAQYVAEVAMDHPLRYQQVHGMATGGGPGGVIAEYLMIGFGNHHSVTLYDNFAGNRFSWEFGRSLLLEDLLSEQTRIQELTTPRLAAHGGGIMDIGVTLYQYPEKVGVNGRYIEGVCAEFNQFDQAEEHIDALEADLDKAMVRFS